MKAAKHEQIPVKISKKGVARVRPEDIVASDGFKRQLAALRSIKSRIRTQTKGKDEAA